MDSLRRRIGCALALIAAISAPSVAAQDSGKRMEDALAFVKLGYGDMFGRQFRSLNFNTEELNTDDAQRVIRLVDSYNAFKGEKVAAALTQFRGRVTSYQFGRERSPVLYINLPYWTHQREGSPKGQGERIDDAEFRKLVAELRGIFSGTLACDEFELDPVRKRTVRIWWD